jgi:hypothetical protein
MVLVGCATRPVGPEGTARGPIATRPGRPGVVVAAPSEQGTGAMAAEIARLTGFGFAATGTDADERRVREAAQGPLVFYVEIRPHDRTESADRIEVTTVGVDSEQSVKLRTLFELVRDAHLRGRPPGMRLRMTVEPAEPARAGGLRVAPRALRLELPRVARQEGRELYTVILADFLREAIALPTPARR